jgi:hypothetical protein
MNLILKIMGRVEREEEATVEDVTRNGYLYIPFLVSIHMI